MSMMENLRAAHHQGVRVDVGLVTGQQFRGFVTGGSDDQSDTASILLTPGLGETPFCIAVVHIVYVRVVDEGNQQYTQPPRYNRM